MSIPRYLDISTVLFPIILIEVSSNLEISPIPVIVVLDALMTNSLSNLYDPGLINTL